MGWFESEQISGEGGGRYEPRSQGAVLSCLTCGDSRGGAR